MSVGGRPWSVCIDAQTLPGNTVVTLCVRHWKRHDLNLLGPAGSLVEKPLAITDAKVLVLSPRMVPILPAGRVEDVRRPEGVPAAQAIHHPGASDVAASALAKAIR